MLACLDIELPSMPRTSHDATDQFSLAKRASLMRTDSIQGMEFAIDIEQSNDSISRD